MSSQPIGSHWRKAYQHFSGAILAGIYISIAGAVYLRVGGVAGACLFAFGLISVVHYQWPLYTGRSGVVTSWVDMGWLMVTLLGNIIGCAATACAVKTAYPQMMETARAVMDVRLGLEPWSVFWMAVGCGTIMTTAVIFAKSGKYLPLIFGVPVFILCGFIHSIADAFYSNMLPYDSTVDWGAVGLCWLLAVAGNFVGCNLVRILQLSRKNIVTD